MILTKEFRFEASHQLYNHPGKCARLHGHSWVLRVCVEGLVRSETGMVLDYGTIKEIVGPIVDRLDHQHLGFGTVKAFTAYPRGYIDVDLCSSVIGLDIDLPTSENLLIWLANQLPPEFPWIQLELNETCTSEAVLTRSDFELNYKERKRDREDSQAQETVDQETASGTEVREGTEVRLTEAESEVTNDDIPF